MYHETNYLKELMKISTESSTEFVPQGEMVTTLLMEGS